jgi:hypothetical protein
MKFAHTALLAAIFVIATSAFAADIYVDQATGNNGNDGLSTGAAVATIARSLELLVDQNASSFGGHTVHVAAGTYIDDPIATLESQHFGADDNRNSIVADGVVTLQNNAGNSISTGIKMNASGPNANMNIDGFDIVGYESAVGNFKATQFTVSNCTFQYNTMGYSQTQGGWGSVFENCVWNGPNRAFQFYKNTGDVTFRNCIFNISGGDLGAGLNNDGGPGDAAIKFEDCLLNGNNKTYGIGCEAGSFFRFTRCIIMNTKGWGINFNATGEGEVINCVIRGFESATTNGVRFAKDGGANIIRNTVITNCVIGLNNMGTGTASNDYNNLYNNGTNYEGFSAGPNSISSDPLFVAPGAGDFRLSAGSPCIDAGDPSDTVPAFGGSIIDIGPVEFGSTAPPPALGDDIWVDGANGDNSNSGTSATDAFATIERGLTELAAVNGGTSGGHVVHVIGATYTDDPILVNSSHFGGSIRNTIQAEGNAVLDSTGAAGNFGVRISNDGRAGNHLNIRGFEVNNYPNGYSGFYAAATTVENCRFNGGGATSGSIGLGITEGGWDAVFQNNEFVGFLRGIQLYKRVSGIKILNNTFDNFPSGGDGLGAVFGSGTAASPVTMDGNVFNGDRSGQLAIGLGAEEAAGSTSYVVFTNNVLKNFRVFGLNISTNCNGIVNNNTFYNVTSNALKYGGGAADVTTARNNIFVNSVTGIGVSAGSIDNDYNNFFNNGTDISGDSMGANATTHDPLFSDPANGDFSLQAGSPSIDAGDPSFELPLACGGGCVIDQGAIEHSGSTSCAALTDDVMDAICAAGMTSIPTSSTGFDALVSQAVQDAFASAGTVCGSGAGCEGDTAGCQAEILAALDE